MVLVHVEQYAYSSPRSHIIAVRFCYQRKIASNCVFTATYQLRSAWAVVEGFGAKRVPRMAAILVATGSCRLLPKIDNDIIVQVRYGWFMAGLRLPLREHCSTPQIMSIGH